MHTPGSHITSSAPADIERHRAIIRKTLQKKSFCMLATSSAENRPHIAGVLYVPVEGSLYVNVVADSIKARNIRANSRVAISIPVRKLPFGPPFNVQFQGSAELLDMEDPLIAKYAEQGRFSGIISKKDLKKPGLCFVRITPGRRVSTFGLGVPLLDVIREPLGAMRSVEW